MRHRGTWTVLWPDWPSVGRHSSFRPLWTWTHVRNEEGCIILDVISWEFGFACLKSPKRRERTHVGTVAFVTLCFSVRGCNKNCKNRHPNNYENALIMYWQTVQRLFETARCLRWWRRLVFYVVMFLFVASEHDFHTVNHVYFSAEKVQFALHLFPKQTIMFCGLHTRTNQ